MRSREIKGIVHFMYEWEEFSENNPDETITENWREGQEGDWVLTDDGTVVQILKRKSMYRTDNYGKGGSQYVRTVCGSFICRPGSRMDSNFRKNIYSFGGDKTAEEHFRERQELTRREWLFVCYYLTDIDNPVGAYLTAFSTKSFKWAKDQAYKLLRQRRIMDAVNQNINEVGEETGATVEWAIRSIKETVDISKDDEIKLKGADMIMRYHGAGKNPPRKTQQWSRLL